MACSGGPKPSTRCECRRETPSGTPRSPREDATAAISSSTSHQVSARSAVGPEGDEFVDDVCGLLTFVALPDGDNPIAVGSYDAIRVAMPGSGFFGHADWITVASRLPEDTLRDEVHEPQ